MNSSSGNIISLIATNGTEFDVKAGQKVIFEVPTDVGFVKGRDCYLSFDVRNTATERFGLDNTAGAQSIINRMDIYSLKTGTHLETLENINQWCGIENQYFYEDSTNLSALEGAGEVVTAQKVNTAASLGAANGGLLPVGLDAGRVADNLLSPIKNDGTPVYQFRRYTIPLRAGIFRWWDDERLCPVIALGGLRIVLTLEDPKVAFSRLKPAGKDGVSMEPGTRSDAVSLSVKIPNDAALAGDGRGFVDSFSTFQETADVIDDPDGVGKNVVRSSLVVGESVEVYSITVPAGITDTITSLTDQSGITEISASDIASGTAAPQNFDTTTSVADLATAGFVVGACVKVTGDGSTSGNLDGEFMIKTVTAGGTGSLVVFAGLETQGNDLLAGITGNLTNVKMVLLPGVAFKTGGDYSTVINQNDQLMNKGAWSPSARVRPELKLVTVVPDGVDMSKGLNYQFTSYDLFVNTLPQLSTKHQVEIPSVATKAIAINSNYVRVGGEQDPDGSSYFTCSAPSQTKLNEVQYYINNKLYPVRSYDPAPKEERVINQNENVKALSTINKEPKNLGSAKGKDIENYTNSYLHSRELARENFVYNLRDAEPQIRLGFSGTRPSSETTIKGGNQTIFTRVWSKKIISMSEAGLQVIL